MVSFLSGGLQIAVITKTHVRMIWWFNDRLNFLLLILLTLRLGGLWIHNSHCLKILKCLSDSRRFSHNGIPHKLSTNLWHLHYKSQQGITSHCMFLSEARTRQTLTFLSPNNNLCFILWKIKVLSRESPSCRAKISQYHIILLAQKNLARQYMMITVVIKMAEGTTCASQNVYL